MNALALVGFVLTAVCAFGWWRERARGKRREDAAAAAAVERRTRQAEALREATGRYQQMFDRMLEGVIVLDVDHHVTLANQAARVFFKTPEATGRALIEVVRNHEIAALARRLPAEEAIAGYELRLEETPPRILQINAVALRDGEERVSGAVLVVHDLTRVRELENARQEFVANVSHELRTPLSLIKGAIEMLIDGDQRGGESRGQLLKIVDRHAGRLGLLIDDLLLLAQLDSGRARMSLQTIAVRGTVQEVCDDLAARAAGREMQLRNDVPAGLLVAADADRLRQVFFNLIDNALKYGRSGGTVDVVARSVGDRIEFTVHDDGPGLPLEAQARVFERFYRVDRARAREQGGTGLGLAIVKHVVQAHGGEVRCESTVGQGAAFIFTLKRAEAATAP